MDNLAVKTAFRKTMALTPRWVHRMLTEEKIRRLTKHLMSKEDRAQCLEHPERRGMILAEHVRKFPEHAARVESETAKVFSDNPLFRDRPEAEQKQLAEDMCYCYFAYGFNVDEYIFFDLSGRNSTDAKRQELVSAVERLSFRFSANDFTETAYADKVSMYNLLRDFYQRDVCVVRSENDKAKYLEFIQKHPRFMEKEIAFAGGKGIRIIDLERLNSVG